MVEPILDLSYWKARLADAHRRGKPHLAVFRCPDERWEAITAKHREILARTIQPMDSVLDAGCGWGRLLDLMPRNWHGAYLGVDLSPDFIAEAKVIHPQNSFVVGDLRSLPIDGIMFHWAIAISIRPMVRRNLGDDVWQQMETELRRVAKSLLFLEYDPDCNGFIDVVQ